MSPHDVALSSDGATLYAIGALSDHVDVFPLNGAPSSTVSTGLVWQLGFTRSLTSTTSLFIADYAKVYELDLSTSNKVPLGDTTVPAQLDGSPATTHIVQLDASTLLFTLYASNCIASMPVAGGAPASWAGVCVAGGTGGYADGARASAQFNRPAGIATDACGGVYVSEYSGHRVRYVAPGGAVTTVAGTGAPGSSDGPAATATFNQPFGLAVRTDGTLFVAEYSGARVRMIWQGAVYTLAGTGTAGTADGDGVTVATFTAPISLALLVAADQRTLTLYVADFTASNIRVLTCATSPRPAMACPAAF